MSKSSNQKLKILHIAEIFKEMTDEEHGLTLAEIIEELKDAESARSAKACITI